jgi:hypothetical protein
VDAALRLCRATAAIELTILDHTMTVLQSVGVVASFGLVLLLLATWSFSRQE